MSTGEPHAQGDADAQQLLHDWQRHMSHLIASLASAGHADLPRQLVEPMQRQLELVKGIAERERRLQQQLASQVAAPVDAVFDLLSQSAASLRLQAEALQAAGRALEEAAGLMRHQAERFDQTIRTLRRPTEIAKAAAGVGHKPHTSPDEPR